MEEKSKSVCKQQLEAWLLRPWNFFDFAIWSIFLICVLLFFAPEPAHAQLWSGVLAPARSMNWSNAGIPGGLPDGNWTQYGPTISPSGGDDGPIITSALASSGVNQYVKLSAGNFAITSISFPRNTIGHRALRGSGANSTFINYVGGVNCNGASSAICISSNDGTYAGSWTNGTIPPTVNWTGGYTQGSTQITLDSVSGIIPNQSVLVLSQCDTGYSGAGLGGAGCANGSAMDNNGYFICSTPYTMPGYGCNIPNFAPDGTTYRPNGWEMEVVMVTAINPGGCGATCVSISQPIEHPNWASGLSPQAVIIQPVPQDGVEDLALDGSSAGVTDDCIGGQNSWETFISGVKCTHAYSRGFYFFQSFHMLIQNNYIAAVSNGNGSRYGDGMGIRISWGADDLIQNNIIQQWKVSFVNDGPSPADVFAYNFCIDQDHAGAEDDYMWLGTYQHATGDDFQLFEGNACNASTDDNIHGGHVNQTRFRNFFWAWESCANGQCGSFTQKNNQTYGVLMYSTSRYGAIVGNVVGTPGYTTIYENDVWIGTMAALNLGAGNNGAGLPPDPLVYSTALVWDNYTTATNSTDCGFANIPTGAPTYPNSMPTLGCSGGTLPASFYLSSKPAWFGSIPFPPIGPDVSNGNIGQCGGTLNVPGLFNGLAATSSAQCAGSGLNAAWAGHVNAIPAQACYFAMGGVPDGTGFPLAFDANSCYATGPQAPPPAAPTNLKAVVS